MLTDAQVRKIRPIDKKKRYSDEKGLYLEVTPSGGRFWRLKYRFNGRESTLTIGSYPEVSLAQARRVRDEARIQLYNNIDPNAAKNQRLEALLHKGLKDNTTLIELNSSDNLGMRST